MNTKHVNQELQEIRKIISKLCGEVAYLERHYQQVLGSLQRVQTLADRDDLTGLLRRKPFFSALSGFLQACEGNEQEVGLIIVDIDHFKRVNDTFGHPTGDAVIRSLADLLKRFESADCAVGRLGGEEFILAVRGPALRLAEEIRLETQRLHGAVVGEKGEPSPEVEWSCTVSVGVATTRKEGFDPARLVQAADQALYCAKQTGRNCVKAA